MFKSAAARQYHRGQPSSDTPIRNRLSWIEPFAVEIDKGARHDDIGASSLSTYARCRKTPNKKTTRSRAPGWARHPSPTRQPPYKLVLWIKLGAGVVGKQVARRLAGTILGGRCPKANAATTTPNTPLAPPLASQARTMYWQPEAAALHRECEHGVGRGGALRVGYPPPPPPPGRLTTKLALPIVRADLPTT